MFFCSLSCWVMQAVRIEGQRTCYRASFFSSCNGVSLLICSLKIASFSRLAALLFGELCCFLLIPDQRAEGFLTAVKASPSWRYCWGRRLLSEQRPSCTYNVCSCRNDDHTCEHAWSAGGLWEFMSSSASKQSADSAALTARQMNEVRFAAGAGELFTHNASYSWR